jgi:hypothetical protein
MSDTGNDGTTKLEEPQQALKPNACSSKQASKQATAGRMQMVVMAAATAAAAAAAEEGEGGGRGRGGGREEEDEQV